MASRGSGALAFLWGALATAASGEAAELPVPCIAGACGASASTFVTAGQASAAAAGNTLTVDQQSDRAILNWQTFNISADGTVNFRQPDSASLALNRIHDTTHPSRIFGALNANGQVYLINRNGIVFGESAKVNVGGLLASSLDLTPEALESGLAAPARQSRAALTEFTDASNSPLPSGTVRVERGATVTTTEGGQILMFAPEIENAGTLQSPGGQTLLAAGSPVYLAASTDPNLRGLLVEVGTGGTVTNAELVGQIVAERGNVTLAGLAVNQLGRVSATTSVRSNGSVRLVAREGGGAQTGNVLTAGAGGALTIGARSITEVRLTGEERTVDVNEQRVSSISLFGRTVDVDAGSRIAATSGQIAIGAQSNWASPILTEISSTPDTTSRIAIAEGATLDVSGTEVSLPLERNVISVELRGSQLADSPAQRSGSLRSQTVQVDIRQTGTRADGSVWRGTPLADVSGDITTIARSVEERSLMGGTVSLISHGDVHIAAGATVDVSGGLIRYQDGYVNTSRIVGTDGRIYDISAADPNRTYAGIAQGYVRESERWGITETFPSFISGPGRFEPGYIEGKDAGSVELIAPRVRLDGMLRAETVAGRHQRRAPLPVAANQLFRAYDQLPLGGEIRLGSPNPISGDHVIDALELRRTPAEGADAATLYLDPVAFGGNGFSRLRAFVNDSVLLPEGASLDLQPHASIIFGGQGRVELLGRLRSAGGALASRMPGDAVVGGSALLDVSGVWVNDNPLLGGTAGFEPLAINGGSVSLSGASVRLHGGSIVDASAGAHRAADGRLTFGSGGTIQLTAGTGSGEPGPTLTANGELRAFAFSRGGTLSLTAPAICITDTDCAGAAPLGVELSPELFRRGGFETYSLTSTLGDLRVRSGTVIAPTQANFELSGDPSRLPSGTPITSLAGVTSLASDVRRAVNLNLETRFPTTTGLPPLIADTFAAAPQLVVERGASIATEPRGRIALATNTRMLVDGSLSAPAGSISLSLDAGIPVEEFLPTQGIWVGAQGRLDARGLPIVRTSDRGIRSGEVLNGGTVSIDALRGYIVLDPESSIDVSGAAATLDFPVAADASGATAQRIVASEGGRISLTAAEGMLLNGSLRAASGAPGSVAGGTLSIRLDAGSRNDPGQFNPVFPTGAREIRISSDPQRAVVAYGTPVPAALNGLALLSDDAIATSGADFLYLSAANLRTRVGGIDNVLAAFGAISFDGDVRLAPAGRLTLDASALASRGGAAQLRSSYVALGQTDTEDQAVPFTLARGEGSLRVTAGLIDLIGASATSGFDSVTLESAGDIRLRGIVSAATGASMPTGRFATAADLLLDAQQIYPTTLSDFTIAATRSAVDRPSRIETRRATGEADPVLSVGGTLRLEADSIAHGGTIRAPFGTIDLSAEDVLLGDGSLLSTSGRGLLIPFGTTQGGFDWTYSLPNGGNTFVYGPDALGLPSQRIELDAARIDFRSSATIDTAGGGDLLAYEFVPGVTGTRDILSPLVRPNQFAIVPSLTLAYAPFDPAESAGFGLAPGESIFLPNGAPGIAPGRYALLPARYALLPGAFLITPASGYTDIAPGQSFARLDGSTVVAGIRTLEGTSLASARSSGYAVRTGSAALDEARYDLSLASEFFGGDASATASGFRLPRDAGTLALLPRESLALRGRLDAQAAMGGRGAVLEIAAEQLLVTTDANESPTGGEVQVVAGELEALGAESIVLGARTRREADGVELEVVSRQVTLDADTRLAGPDITLAAREAVRMGGGSTLTAAGPAVQNGVLMRVEGDAAVVRVSTGEALELERTGATSGAAGTIAVAWGATVRSRGSALLDSTAAWDFDGSLDVTDASLWLGAPSIALGAAPSGAAALLLDGAQLSGQSLRELSLAAPSALNVFGASTLSAERLTLRLPGIIAGDAAADLRANATGVISIIGGTQAPDTSATVSLSTRVALHGGSIDLDGNFGLQGFDTATLAAASDLSFTSNGELASSGALHLRAGRIFGADAVRFAVRAGGALDLQAADAGGAAGATSSTEAPGLGTRIELTGTTVNHATQLLAPAGVVLVQGTEGDVSVGGTIDTRGQSSDFDGRIASAPGGLIRVVSERGSIALTGESVLDVSAAQVADARAGRIELIAPEADVSLSGVLRGSSPAPSISGELLLDARSFGSFAALNETLDAGGFHSERSIRLRGPGDLSVDAGRVVRAARVKLVADQGSIAIGGTLDARGPAAGQIRLHARDGIGVDGSLFAGAQASGERGGLVELGSSAGGARFSQSSLIDVSGAPASGSAAAARGGDIRVRVERTELLGLLDGDPANDRMLFAGSRVGDRSTTIEGFRSYLDADAQVDATDVFADLSNPLFADAAAFMQRAAEARDALGAGGDTAFRIVPGIEIRSSADACVGPCYLRVASVWNLADWRFDGAPGVLTLRAAGNLLIDSSISDGFVTPSDFTLTQQGDSWSYRLVSGWDGTTADPLARAYAWQLPSAAGSVRLAAGGLGSSTTPGSPVMVRTGTGSIELAAARDLALGNQASVIYTAGRATGIGVPLTGQGTLGGREYPVDGGDISIAAGNDILGARSNQMITDWLWRTGSQATATSAGRATGWTVNFARFQQNVGALAGGTVSVRADGDITDLSVSLPGIGRQIGGTTAAESRVEGLGGGRLDVRASGNVSGGTFYVGLGEGTLRTHGDFGRDPQAALEAIAFAPVLALGDAQLSVYATGSLSVASVLTPTLLPPGRSQQTSVVTRSHFSTYSDSSSVSLVASGGSLSLLNSENATTGTLIESWAPSMNFLSNDAFVLRLYPPTLHAVAFAGDISVPGNLSLFPSPSGNLELLAARDFTLGTRRGPAELIVSDAELAALPSIARPVASLVSVLELFQTSATNSRPGFFSEIPTHSAARRPLGQPLSPARIVARDGDVRVLAEQLGSATSIMFIAKPVRIHAGRDIRDLGLIAQNVDGDSITSLTAGRDITYSNARTGTGALDPSDREIIVLGPGSLQLHAGRTVDLQTSGGISTFGNVRNVNLPAGGADVSVLAGVAASAASYAAFTTKYLENGTAYDQQLLAHVALFGSSPTSKADALAQFRALDPDEQRPLLEQIFLAEVRAGGRAAAQAGAGNGDFTRAFAALEALFPGSNPDLDAGERNPYAGDIRLFFSRIYTLAGGDISLFAPGGEINVGLATPPVAFGITKQPSDLGIVVQQTGSVGAVSFADFQVNESRTFAADGGNILVWSTRGDIDAGRGAKTALSAPPPTIRFDENGRPIVTFPPALTGSGIQTLATTAGRKPGDVDLFAPRGVVNAGDAGIVAGNLTIAATAVLGASNIKVSGTAVGVPVDAGGLAAGLTGVSNVASSASSAATASVEAGAERSQDKAPLADEALGWLDVFIEGFGEEVCKPTDLECLKRNQKP